MKIEEIDRYCDLFEDRLKSGDSISLDSFIKELQLPSDAQLALELRRVQQEYGKAQILNSTVAYQVVTPSVSDRYSPLKFHARGGVGEVWIAEDEEIGRQVALKQLSRDEEGANERFLAEAQIAGQLEHPGVVPVHDLGIDKSGKPYYVMKFVHGRTLRDAIEEYHVAGTGRNGRGGEEGRALQQQRLLDHFIDVCEAIAFAHTRGVVHRDIKPSNIMLGLFGETIVLDWGLAKVLNQPELPGLPTAVTSSGRSSETAQGSVLGTPAYMPPEIADGKAAEAGPPVDVYLLGATLYEILTGSPPRSGSSRDEIVELARTVQPVPPREKNPKVARALEAICMKAMAKRDRDRYESALDVAEDIRRYLAGAPVSAYPEPLPTRLWRWTKRHRVGLLRGATAALFLTMLFVAADAWNANARMSAENRAREEISQFRRYSNEAFFYTGEESEVAEENQQFVYYNPKLGRAAMDQALQLAESWGADLESLNVGDESERIKLQRELYELQLLRAQFGLAFPASDSSDEVADALQRAASIGFNTASLNRLLSSFSDSPDSAGEADNNNSPDPNAFDHFLSGEQLRTQSIATKGSRQAQLEAAIEHYRNALRLKPDHYWSRLQLGRCLLALEQYSEATGTLGGCIALQPDFPWAYTARALALSQLGRFDEALADLDYVLSLDQDFQPARLNRGVVYWQKGDFDKASRDFQDVLAADDGRLILAAFYLGQMSLQQGKRQEALVHFREFANGSQLKGFRAIHLALAKTHYLLGENDAGLTHLNTFIKLDAAPRPFQADGAGFRVYRGKFLRELATGIAANILEERKLRFGENSPDVREGEEIRDKILQAAIEELQPALAQLQADLQELQAAIEKLQPALRKLNAAKVKQLTQGIAKVCFELASAYENLEQFENAEKTYLAGLQLNRNHLRLNYKLGELRYKRQDYELARDNFDRACGLQPAVPIDNLLIASAHSYSGILSVLDNDKQAALRQAEFAAAKLLELNPPPLLTFQAHHNVACIYGGLSQLNDDDREHFQEMAIKYIDLALDNARNDDRLAFEIGLIQKEDDRLFGPELKADPRFQRLLQEARKEVGASDEVAAGEEQSRILLRKITHVERTSVRY